MRVIRDVKRLSWLALGVGLTLILLRQAGGLGSLGGSLPATFGGPDPAATAAGRPTRQERVLAEGRVTTYPGAEVVVGTEIEGLILRLPVEERTVVRQGDLIAELQADVLQASLAEAEAQVALADVEIDYFGRELARQQRLRQVQAVSETAVLDLRRDLEVARARRQQAVASRTAWEARVAKTRIGAPRAGVVVARFAHPGEVVPAAARLVTLADLTRLRIEAEVDEFDAAKIALDADVTVTAEGYPHPWRGRVEEIPDAVVGRRLRPGDPGRPIDTRVLPVKIALCEPIPLKLGQRVEVMIRIPEDR